MSNEAPWKPDRRTILKTAAAGTVIAATTAGATATSPPRKLKKAVKFGMVGEGNTVLEKFQLLEELGFDGLEIDSPSNLDLDEVLEAKRATGLVVHGVVDSVHWRKPFSDPDPTVRAEGCAALETALRDCAKVGGTTVLVVPAVVGKQVAYDDAYRRSQEAIGRFVPLAEELGIDIAFENVWNNFLLSPLEAAHYVDEFESERVGFYLDIGNIVLYGWPEQWARILGPRIRKLDIKDFSREKLKKEGLWKGFEAKIGEGDAGWPDVMKAIDEIGYEGWGTAEVGGGGRERLAEIAANMDRVFAS